MDDDRITSGGMPWANRRRRRNDRRAPLSLLIIAGLTALFLTIPIAYVLIGAAGGGREAWGQAVNIRLPALLWSTGVLTLVVTAASAVIGTLLAFLVVRTDLPGRRHFKWLLAMPLAFPPYVGALSYIMIFGPSGWLRERTGVTFFSIYDSLFSISLLLTLFCYPYVYLIVMASLQRMRHSYVETAQSCGISRSRMLFNVFLPLLLPAIGSGSLLVALYVLSDFGAVAMLRYDTFVSAIYYQIEGRFDRTGAAILSTVLIAVTVALVWVQRHGGHHRGDTSSAAERQEWKPFALQRWRRPAVVFAVAVLTLAVLLPAGALCAWSWRGIAGGAVSAGFWSYTFNSMGVAAMVSIACMAVTLPVVYIQSRYPSLLTRLIHGIAYAGYALPGVVVALGVVFFFHRFLPVLYATMAMIVFAHFMRFLPQSLGSGAASLAQISPTLDEAARSLGDSPGRTMRRVIYPLMLPGLLTGGTLVFVSSLKELPATLLLRPAGFDTLSVRVWIEAGEGFYDMAAPAALLIVAVAALPVKWLMDFYVDKELTHG